MIRETLGMDTKKEKTLDLNTQKEESVDLVETENMEVDDDGSVVEVGKSFSVPGFLRNVFTEELGDDDGGRHHKLLVIAVHAVLLESGFVGFDPVSNMEVSGFPLGDEWPSAMFRMSLWYTLPELIGQGRVDVNGIDTVVLKFQSLGKFFTVYGSLSNGSGTYRVHVDEGRLVPFLNVVWANCGLTDEINGKDGFSGTSPEREVFKFWKTVKDRLALPLLIDLCEKAGLPSPPCFMRLPTDLKLKILESLPGVDLAKVGCVCSELRYLASSDDLWKQKFAEQFGNAVVSEGGIHWKEKFAKSWEGRKTARKFLGPRGRRGYNPFRVPPIIGGDYDVFHRRGYNPFRGPPIIGGDYDVLPRLGFPYPPGPTGRAYHRFRNAVPNCNLGGHSS